MLAKASDEKLCTLFDGLGLLILGTKGHMQLSWTVIIISPSMCLPEETGMHCTTSCSS